MKSEIAVASAPYCLPAVFGLLVAAGCSGGAGDVGPDLPDASDAPAPADAALNDATAADTCPAYPAGPPHSIVGNVALTMDSMGVPFFTQNGSMVHVPAASIVGKTLVWATVPGGDQLANVATLTEFGTLPVAADLTAHFKTKAQYANGPWELAVFISVTGGDIVKGPQPGDLAAFDLTPPPACEPPVTGTSIRVTIDGADATVNLANSSFIRF
jgi:hypothetical protein